MIRISFESAGLSFGSQELFSGLTLSVPQGRITAVTGQNGSGKSTFLRLAAKFISPDTGNITAEENGRILEKDAFRSRIAMVTPELKLYPKLTAEENLQFLLGLRNITLSAQEITELWHRVGLRQDELQDRLSERLSTGMRQRVKLAVLLAADVPFWFLDEPGANLDASGLEIVIKEARRAADEGRLILWATNDPREEDAADEFIRLPMH